MRLWMYPVLAVLILQSLPPTNCQSHFLGYAHCSQLAQEESRQYCLNYINTNSADVKYSTAVLWSKYRPASFRCANITWSCLVSDMRAEAYGSSCMVSPNGAPCQQDGRAMEGSCWQGLCLDPAQVAVNMLLDQQGSQPSGLRLFNSNMRMGSEINRQLQASINSKLQQQLPFTNRRTAAPIPMPYEYSIPQFMQAGSGNADPDTYDYDSSLLPPTTSTTGIPGAPADDPYGLNIELPDTPLISDPFRPPQPAPPPPPPPATPSPAAPQRAQLTMDIQPDSFIGVVPASFLGISREWGPQVFYDKNLEAFGNIFEVLGPSPIIRIGGFSQESLLRPPNSTYLNSLKTLHCQLGIRYIIGLPLFQNAPELCLAIKKTFDEAFKDLPFAILSYELGNEPNYWPGTGAGGVRRIQGATQCIPVNYNDPSYQLVGTMDPPTDKPGGVDGYAMYTNYQEPYVPYKASQYCFTPQQLLFVAGIPSYQNFFQTTARSITGCGGAPTSDMQALWGFPYWGPPGFNRQVISGPAWGDFASFNISSLVDFLRNSESCYLSEVTIHYYGPNRNTTWEALFQKLTGDPADQTDKPLTDIVREYVDASRLANVGLRISEANTVPDGGQSDFSNTLGAALWTVVTAMEFAKAGTTGINFHWGNGGIPQNPAASPAYIGVQAMFENGNPDKPYPVARVPWYGYVMFSRALGNNGPGMFLNFSTNALAPGNVCNRYVFPYALLVPHAGMISVIVVNANQNVTCDFTATLPGVVTTAAVLQRLEGPKGMQSVPGVTFAGQTYQGSTNGKILGTYRPEIIQPHQETIRTTGWTFPIAPGSGVLVQIPLSGGAANQMGYPPVTPDLVTGGTQQAAPTSSAVFTPPEGVPSPPAGQADAAQQMQVAAGAASQGPGSASTGFMSATTSTGTTAANQAESGGTIGAGRYVLKGHAADGSPIYRWMAAAGSSYGSSSEFDASMESGGMEATSSDLSAGFRQASVVPAPAGSSRAFGPGSGNASSSRSSSPGRGLGSLFGGLFNRSGRRLMSAVGGVLSRGCRAVPSMRSLLQIHPAQQQPMPALSGHQPGPQATYAYINPDIQHGVDPKQHPAAASAASQYGAPAPSGIGRVWPTNANTSTMDVGLFGLGGYTLLPPGYDQAAIAKAAAQCPGIARIMAIQAKASRRR